MDADPFDEAAFFTAIATSGARTLLIGRRALIALGIPVLTSDYDLWIHADDAESLNRALLPLDLFPNRSPEEARRVGRYVLENGERVDVLVARQVSTVDGEHVRFEDVFARAQRLPITGGSSIAVPSIDDLIRTKRFGARARDADDIELLVALRSALFEEDT
jgi:hypothetical protein